MSGRPLLAYLRAGGTSDLPGADGQRPACRAPASPSPCAPDEADCAHRHSASCAPSGGRWCAPGSGPAGSRRRPADRERRRCRACRSSSAGPMPESCRSCGDCTAPADRITSRSARAASAPAVAAPIRRRPRAFPSSAMRVACARRDHRQIGPRQRRAQERNRGAFAPALADAELVGADAVGRLAVEVGVGWQAELLRSVDPGAAGGMIVAQRRHLQRPMRAAILARRAVESARACGSAGARRGSPSPRRPRAPSRRSPRAGRG